MKLKIKLIIITVFLYSCSHNSNRYSRPDYLDHYHSKNHRGISSTPGNESCLELLRRILSVENDFFKAAPVEKQVIDSTVREFTEESLESSDLAAKMAIAYPENRWLAGPVHASPNYAPPANGTVKFPSEYVFNERHIEFDRNMNGISFLHWAQRGRDDLISAVQPNGNKFSAENLANFQALLNKVLPTQEDWDAMLAYMAIHDLGKVEAFQKFLKESLSVDYLDHDKLLLEALERKPELFPSFHRLSKKHKEMIIKGMQADFNMGQLLQGENLAGNLKGLEGLDDESLNFYMVHIVADIAGAVGHARPDGSIVMTKSTYEGFQAGIEALNGIGDGRSLTQVYHDFLKIRGAGLGLSPTDDISKASIKVSLMLRISDPAQAKQVSKVISDLPQDVRSTFLDEINRNGISDGIGFLLYYSPATMSNLSKSMEFDAGIKLGIEKLTEAYQLARQSYGNGANGVKTILISDMAELAKSPNRLQSARMKLSRRGEDGIIYFEHHFEDIVELQNKAGYRVEGQEINPIYVQNFGKYRTSNGKFKTTVTVDGAEKEITEVQELGARVKNRVVKMSDGSIYKIPKTPENAVTLEVEKVVNEDLKRNFWNYGITVDNILEEGLNGSWLKQEFFNSDDIAENILKRGDLSNEQLAELEKAWKGARKYAEETGIALDFTADNLYWNGKTWVLYDTSPRTSSGARKYKYTTGVDSFSEFLEIWNRGYFSE